MVLDALKKDKKRQGDRIYFVWLNGIGNAFVDRIPMGELEAVIDKHMEPV
jgi:3-dehydroquinate synthetase